MRILGYYWIKPEYKSEWIIAEYIGQGIFFASNCEYREKVIFDIDENEIRRSWHIVMPVNYKDCDNVSKTFGENAMLKPKMEKR